MIACAYREMNPDDIDIQKGRGFYENRMVFLGFIVFENQLKPASLPILNEIKSSNISSVMVTGDNIFTAISVARACQLIRPHEDVFLPNFFGPNNIHLVSKDSHFDMNLRLDSLQNLEVSFACSGEEFDCMLNTVHPYLFARFLKSCRIYGRMSPMQKKRLVEAYQSIGECVCFCGDGANDCAALTAADVGVSLSEAESSIAAPFTSNICDISCLPILLRNGRSSIVTSISSFKFMSLYSIVQFTTLSFLYTFGSTLSDWQFIYMDLFLIIPLGILLNEYEPAKVLALSRPEVKLISPDVLIPIFSQLSLQAIFQGFLFFYTRCIVPPTQFSDGPNVENAEATALALFSNFIYITQAYIFSEGHPHRQAHYRIHFGFESILFFRSFYLVYCHCHFSKSGTAIW